MRSEKDIINEFHNFYMGLANKDHIFYMFFTKGLLFWVNKSLSFIPKDVNIVLIGAGLTGSEINWIKDTMKRPFFSIDMYVDDKKIWNMLFEVNQNNFGWIDIDCFVINPQLFYEIIKIEESVAINSIWSWESNLNFEFQSTYFLYINADVIKELKAKGVDITPHAYVYEHMKAPEKVGAKIISNENMKLLKSVIVPDIYPIPKTFNHGLPFFDTLLLYQIITRAYGYKMYRVRCLNHSNYMSNEIIHVGDSSFFTALNVNKPKFLGDNYKIYLYIAYLLIDSMLELLPVEYKIQKKIIISQMKFSSFDKNRALDEVTAYMLNKGINSEVIGKLINFNI